jgi:HEAT repeat protein
LGVLVGIASLGVLASALVVRKHYARALIAMLEQEDYSSLLSEGASALTAADPATLNWLKDRLAASTSPELTIFTARIISEAGGKEAIPILRSAAQAASDPRVRAAIIDILASTGAQGDQVRDLYGEFLSDADANVRL